MLIMFFFGDDGKPLALIEAKNQLLMKNKEEFRLVFMQTVWKESMELDLLFIIRMDIQ